MQRTASVKDHDRIVGFMEKNALLVVATPDIQRFIKKKVEPPPSVLLIAALKLNSMDAKTRESIRRVLKLYREVDQMTRKHGPPESDKRLERIMRLVKRSRSLRDLIQMLEREAAKAASSSLEDIGLRCGIDVALRIVRNREAKRAHAR